MLQWKRESFSRHFICYYENTKDSSPQIHMLILKHEIWTALTLRDGVGPAVSKNDDDFGGVVATSGAGWKQLLLVDEVDGFRCVGARL